MSKVFPPCSDGETGVLPVATRLLFPDLPSMMDHFGLDPAQFTLGKDANGLDYYNSPRAINRVVAAAHTLHPGLHTLLVADELRGCWAPDRCDWRGVEDGLPEDSTLLLTYNPGTTTKPLKLPSSPSFHHVTSELSYRNTLSILQLHTCLAQHMTEAKPATPPGQGATDVRGEAPLLLDLGYSKEPEGLGRALEAAREALGEGVTVMPTKALLSPESLQVLRDTVSQWASWRVEEGNVDGWEWEKVVVVGLGELEEVSRARSMLAVVRVCQVEEYKWLYDWYTPGYREAQRAGLVRV